MLPVMLIVDCSVDCIRLVSREMSLMESQSGMMTGSVEARQLNMVILASVQTSGYVISSGGSGHLSLSERI